MIKHLQRGTTQTEKQATGSESSGWHLQAPTGDRLDGVSNRVETAPTAGSVAVVFHIFHPILRGNRSIFNAVKGASLKFRL